MKNHNTGAKSGSWQSEDDLLYRERSTRAAREHETEEDHERNRLLTGHVRCGGGWWVRRKRIGGD